MSNRYHLSFAFALLFTAISLGQAATLPQQHDDQRILRDYLASLEPAAFALSDPLPDFGPPPAEADLDSQFKAWLLLKGRQAGAAATLAVPSAHFSLAAIEGQEQVRTPLPSTAIIDPAWLATWESPMNPYQGSQALKQRALCGAIIDLIMLDHQHEQGIGTRSDLTCGPLIRIAYVYKATRELLPENAQAAFEIGLKRIVSRVDKWGPTGINGNMDFFGTVALWYAWEATGDSWYREAAERYLDRLLTPPRFFDAAGFTRDAGAVDMSYEGITRFFGTWGALVTRQDIILNAMDASYRLKNLTSLPEPDGNRYGPSHMSARTSAGSPHDQWNFHFRDFGAAMFTERALPWLTLPGPEELAAAPTRLVGELNRVKDAAEPGDLKPWIRKGFVRNVNYTHAHYTPGFAEQLLRLREEQPARFALPFEREGDFVEALGDDFVAAKLGNQGIVLHTGPISLYKGVKGIKSPWGFGGGQLAAFWGESTGSVMLGRRRNAYIEATHDRWDEWRQWPSHAVSGLTSSGKVVTSARIRQPEITSRDLQQDRVQVQLRGELPADCPQQGTLMSQPMAYTRAFDFSAAGLTVRTTVTGNGEDHLTELYETLPVFLYNALQQKSASPAEIHLQREGVWQPATASPVTGVQAIRIDRWEGSVQITFAQPRTVQLSPEVWRQDQGWMGNAHCRNILIDLLPGNPDSGAFQKASTDYTITLLSADNSTF